MHKKDREARIALFVKWDEEDDHSNKHRFLWSPVNDELKKL